MPPPRDTKRARGSRRKSLKPQAPGSSDNISSDATHESVSSWRPSLGTHSYKWEQQKGRDTSFESSSRQGRGRERDLERSRSASRRARSAARLSASAARLRQGSSGGDSDDSVKFVRRPNEGDLRRVVSARERSVGQEPGVERPREERVRERGSLERRSTGEKGETSSQRALRVEGAFGSDASVEARPRRRSKQRDPAFASDSSFSFMKVDETIEEASEEVSTVPVSRPRLEGGEQEVLARPVDIAPPNLRTGPLGDRQFAKPSRNRGVALGEEDGDSGIAQLTEGSLSRDSELHQRSRSKAPTSPRRQGDVSKVAAARPPVTKSSLFGGEVVEAAGTEVDAERPPFQSVEFNSGGGASCAGGFGEEPQVVAANKPKKGHRERKAHRHRKDNDENFAEADNPTTAMEKKSRARSPFKMAIFGRGRDASGEEKDVEGAAAAPKERSKSPFRFPGFGGAFKGRALSEEEQLAGKMEKRARSKSPLFSKKPQVDGGENVKRARSKSPFKMPGFGKHAPEQGEGEGVEQRGRSKSPFSRLRFGVKSKDGPGLKVPAPGSEPAEPEEPVPTPTEARHSNNVFGLLEETNVRLDEGLKVPTAEASKRARSKSPFRMPRFGKKGPKEEPLMMKDQNHVAAVQLLFVKGHLPGGDLALSNPVKTRGRSKSPFQRPETAPKAAEEEAPEVATKKQKAGRARSPFARMFSSKKVGRASDAEYRPTAAPSAWTEGLVQLSDEEPDVTSAPAQGDVSKAAVTAPAVPQAEGDGLPAPDYAPQAYEVSEAPENEPVFEAPSDARLTEAEGGAEQERKEDQQTKGYHGFEALAAEEGSESVPAEPVPVMVPRISAEEDAAKAPKKSPLKRLKSRQHR